MSTELQDLARQINKENDSSNIAINPDQVDFINTLAPNSPEELEKEPVEKQKTRMALQGLTFGFADEIEALAKSLSKDTDYKTARNQIRAKLNDYKEEHGAEALAMEMAGAVLPTVLSIFGGPGAWTASLSNMVRFGKSIFSAGKSGTSVAQVSAKAGAEGLVYGTGASDKETVAGVGTDALQTSIASALISPILAVGGKKLAPMLTSNFLTRMFTKTDKDSMTLPVREELAKMVEKTGLTELEIVQKIVDGEIITENQSLLYYIKDAVKDSGTAAKNLLDETAGRPKQTRDELITTMQKSINRGDVDENLTKIYKQSDDEFRTIENKQYASIFKDNNVELDNLTTGQVLESIRKFQGGAETINKMFAGQDGKLVPFFKMVNNEVRLVRQPTIQDAEIIYRAIRNEKDKLFRSGETDLSMIFKDNMVTLKNALDNFSPELAAVRKAASDLRTSRNAYKYGLSAMSKRPEDIAMFIEDIADTPNAMQSLRDGILIQLKGKDAVSISRSIASQDKNLNKIIRMVFPDESLDDIISKANIATQASNAKTSIPISAGPQSTPLAQAATQSAGQDVIPTLINKLSKTWSERGIPEQQAIDIVKVVTSQNPDLVRKALIDDNAMNMVQKMVDALLTEGSKIVGNVSGKVLGQNVAERRDPMHGLLEYANQAVGQLGN